MVLRGGESMEICGDSSRVLKNYFNQISIFKFTIFKMCKKISYTFSIQKYQPYYNTHS